MLPTPKNTTEKLLKALSDSVRGEASSDLISPSTNTDKLLKALIEKVGGSEPTNLPTPKTNTEHYLTDIVLNYSGSSGGELVSPIFINGMYKEITSGSALSMAFNEPVGALLVVSALARHTNTISDSSWTLLHKMVDSTTLSNSITQTTYVYYKYSTGSDTFTITNSSANRICIAGVSLKADIPPVVTTDVPSGFFTGTQNVTKSSNNFYLWICSSGLWGNTSPYGNWKTSVYRQIIQYVSDGTAQTRLAVIIDPYPPELLAIMGDTTTTSSHLMVGIKIPKYKEVI